MRLPCNKPDNHLFDCIASAGVGASIEGVKLFGMDLTARKKRKPIILSELQKK